MIIETFIFEFYFTLEIYNYNSSIELFLALISLKKVVYELIEVGD